jgi:hypothetical protein
MFSTPEADRQQRQERDKHQQPRSLEQVHVELLEACACDGGVEVNALVQAVQLNAGLGSRGQRALGALAGCAQAAQGAGVVADVLLVLALELLWGCEGGGGQQGSSSTRVSQSTLGLSGTAERVHNPTPIHQPKKTRTSSSTQAHCSTSHTIHSPIMF